MPDRIEYLDTAKALGMILVFQGHLLERSIGNNIVVSFQSTLIYSFHMLFFFFVSGLFFKEKNDEDSILGLKKIFFRRLVPVAFFNLVGLVFFIVTSLASDKPLELKQIILNLLLLIKGFPHYNYITWFLICLYSTECINLIQYRLFGKKAVFYSIPTFAFIGYSVCLHPGVVINIFGIEKNYWFIYSALTAIVFYQCGIVFKHYYLDKLSQANNRKIAYYLVPLLSIWFFCSKLNLPYLKEEGANTVLINGLILGNFFYFYLAAFAGSLSLLLVSKLMPTHKTLSYFGCHSLILLGIQGIIYSYIDPHFTLKLPNPYILFLASWTITFFTYISCYPFIKPVDKMIKVTIMKLNPSNDAIILSKPNV